MSKVILKINDLHKIYEEGSIKTEVLKGINLEIYDDEMTAIVGSSGSGKSTLLHMMGTLDQPTSGEILFDGQSITNWNSNQQAEFRNRRLGFIYQFHHLLNEFTASENVQMPLLIAGVSKEEAQSKALDLLGKVGLEHRVDHKPSELSGGERQRVAIARALVNSPSLVLADEPTGNLDFKTAEEIFAIMCKMHEELGTAFVVVTHDRELAERFDRKIEICDGQVKHE